jgi:transglutaminase-like putative cysteine protease
MDSYGEDKGEGQQVKSNSNWPIVVGVVFLVMALLAVSGVFAWKLGWLSALNPFSRWSTPVEISIEPTASSGNTLPGSYQWSYDGRNWSLTMPIPESLYLYYSKMERAPVEDYSIYVTHPLDDNFTASLAAELKKQASGRHYDDEETVNFAASFVQNLAYIKERDEYPKYPVETLFDKGGDCEDTAILTAALLQAMGYDAVLLRFSPPKEGDAGHMAVGVAVTGVSGGRSYSYDGQTYYYLETTSSWPLGEIPDDILSKYKGKTDGIYQLLPAPALRFTDFTWSVERRWFSDTTVDLKVTVTNWGTADADAFYVRAYFEAHESAAKSSAAYDLAYDHQISGVATKGIALPSGGGALRVELFQDGEIVDDWSRVIA